MEHPYIEIGKGNRIEQTKSANFKMFDRPVYKANIPLKCCLLHFNGMDVYNVKKIMETTAKNIDLKLEFKVANVGQYFASEAFEILAKELQHQHQKNYHNIYFIILPPEARGVYPKLKNLCFCELGVSLQIALETFLQKREFATIATKLLLQMAAKVGNVLWVPRSEILVKNDVMVIGFNSGSEKSKAGKKRVAVCASIDKDISRFYTESVVQEGTVPMILDAESLIVNSLNTYYTHNGRNSFPQEVIVLRDGCSTGQIAVVKEFELAACQRGITECATQKAYTQPIRLTFVVIDKKPSQKFFSEYHGQMQNPQAGIIVSDGLVSEARDFYLISQMSMRGSSIPTFYQILFTDSVELQPGMIEEIVFTQCYNYSNWTGSIKIPSPLQYAKKLCEFTSTNMKEAPVGMERLPYFI